MSSTLCWRAIETVSKTLPFELKKTLSRKLWDTDGSCGGSAVTVDASLIPYLEGLRDAHVEGAQKLIDLINKHGQIELWHEH